MKLVVRFSSPKRGLRIPATDLVNSNSGMTKEIDLLPSCIRETGRTPTVRHLGSDPQLGVLFSSGILRVEKCSPDGRGLSW